MVDEIYFRDLTPNDLLILKAWFRHPHVMEYWQESDDNEKFRRKFLVELRERSVIPFVVFMKGEAIGYIQYYEACKIGGGWWTGVPEGVFGIDQFIGEPHLIGKGIGSAMIKRMTDFIFDTLHAREVIADPDPANVRAIRAFEKAGFKKVSKISTPGGDAMLMRILRNNDK